MQKVKENEVIKSLTDENAELTESICSWSKNCAQLTTKMTKLQMANKKLTAENRELKNNLESSVAQLQSSSKDTKYVMELLDKTTLQNKQLKAENHKLAFRLVDQNVAEHGRDQKTSTSDYAELRKIIQEKDDLIEFHKEICDAKVSEVKELQQINRILKNTINETKKSNKK